MGKGIIISGIIILILIIGGLFAYYNIISPTAVKPQIERPPLPTQTQQTTTTTQTATDEQQLEPAEIEEEHIQYLVNEIGGYNLHDDPINSEPAIMQFDVEDVQKSYTIIIEDNFPSVSEGEAEQPDIILHANQAVLVELLQAEDFNAKTIELMNNGQMWMEVIADEATLAMKGYKSIYDQVTGGSDEITGNVVAQQLRPENNFNRLDWP